MSLVNKAAKASTLRTKADNLVAAARRALADANAALGDVKQRANDVIEGAYVTISRKKAEHDDAHAAQQANLALHDQLERLPGQKS